MTRLKLLTDYHFGRPVADRLNDLGAVTATHSTGDRYQFKKDEDDDVIVRRIKDDGYIFLTHDRNTIKADKFPPCSHAGIIIIKDSRWSEEKVFERIRALCLSGQRKLAAHAITYLSAQGARFLTHSGTVVHRWGQ